MDDSDVLAVVERVGERHNLKAAVRGRKVGPGDHGDLPVIENEFGRVIVLRHGPKRGRRAALPLWVTP